MPIRNFYSLEPDECIVAERDKSIRVTDEREPAHVKGRLANYTRFLEDWGAISKTLR
jgi:hypothetical protein